MLQRPEGNDWIGLTDEPLPLPEALAFSIVAGCGGLVSFVGTVRDFSEGREGVSALEYEAYPEQVLARLKSLVASARTRWPETGRIVALHRVGHLEVTEAAVVVCASTPHRAEAFEVARYLIDTLKATIPIWKRETWLGGSQWSEGNCEIADLPPASGPHETHHHGEGGSLSEAAPGPGGGLAGRQR